MINKCHLNKTQKEIQQQQQRNLILIHVNLRKVFSSAHQMRYLNQNSVIISMKDSLFLVRLFIMAHN
jgi:hypothetical protein